MAHKGIPDYQRAARYILKDFVTVCVHIFLLVTWMSLSVVFCITHRYG